MSLFLFSCKNKSDNAASDKNKPQNISIDKWSEKIKADPNNAELYNERANVYLAQKLTDNALSDINKAISINSKKPAFYCTLSDIYFSIGKVVRCEEALNKAIDIDSKNPEALLKLAELNFFFKKYNKTFEYIKKALDVDKINPKAYFMRGMALKENGDTARAIADLQTASEQDPQNVDTYIQLGLLFSAKKNKLAIDYFNNALNIDPKNIEAKYAKAMFFQETGEYNKAIETYSNIAKENPSYKFAYYNLGYIHLVYLKVYNVAIDYFTQAIKADPAYFEAYYNRGYSFEMRGDITNARADYKKALEIKTNYQKAIDGLNRISK